MKKLSALLREITSNNKEDFYCLNCFHWCTIKCKLENRYNISKNIIYCYAEGPREANKILKYIHARSSMKVPFIIYADLESLPEKKSTCHNNPGKSSAVKINEHTAAGYSLLTHCSFDLIKK